MPIIFDNITFTGGILLSGASGSTPPPPPPPPPSGPLTLEYVTTSNGQSTRLYLSGTRNASINWGDNTANTTVSSGDASVAYDHVYTNAGTYTVTVTGSLSHLGSTSPGTNYIGFIGPTKVLNFGNVGLTSLQYAFRGCSQLIEVPSSLPSTVTSLEGAISFSSFNHANIGSWDTSNVTNMSIMFQYASSFNQDISNWNTSNVTTMFGMFQNATVFNKNITRNGNSWNTGNVTQMGAMFQAARAFNGNIINWNTSSVTSMTAMFNGAWAFNQNIARNGNSWNTSNVTTMNNMFNSATGFNQNLSNWCVSLIAVAPTGFDSNATAWTGGSATRPQWGTCP